MDEARKQWLKRLAILLGTGTFLLIIIVTFHEVLVPFVIAVVLAYVLHPAVEWIHRRRIAKRNIPRWSAVLIIYALLFSLLSLFFTTLLPRLGVETTALVRAVPGFITHVKDDWLPRADRWLGSSMGSLMGEEEGEGPSLPRPLREASTV